MQAKADIDDPIIVERPRTLLDTRSNGGPVICPTGKSVTYLSSPIAKNISLRAGPKSLPYSPPSHPTEGRIAIVTDAGWDAVDAGGALTRARACGRRSRVVLTPRRWRQVCGWRCQPLTGLTRRASDGDNKARSPRRARRKPLKPLRAGMPGEPAYPW